MKVNSEKLKHYLSSKSNHFLPAGIYFRVIGHGKCNWTDFLRRDSIPVETNKNERNDIKFWGDEEYVNATVYVIGSKNGKIRKKLNFYLYSFNKHK